MTLHFIRRFCLLSLIWLIVPPKVFALDSTIATSLSTVTASADSVYPSSATPNIRLHSTATFTQKLSGLFGRLTGKETAPTLTVQDPQNQTILTQAIKSGESQVSLANLATSPGDYTVKVDDQPTLTFAWGVLTLNSDQDVYNPGETAYLQAAALSSTGHTLCDANLSLTISGTPVPLTKNSSCGADNVTDEPDYFAHYPLPKAGLFALELTNLETGHKITSSLRVDPSAPYTITRTGATRINPFKADYQMSITVTAHTDFTGSITEQLPPGFKNLSELSWQASMTKGESLTFTYRYHAPAISPAIFALGPLKIGSYTEPRTWSLASDATFQMQTGYYIGTGTDNLAITGVGFQPQLVLIKDDTGNGVDGVNWKSSSMSSEINSTLADSDADTTTDAIQSLDSDGFTLGTDADVNTANIRFVWIAFRGSDCTSSGTFCVGSYTGDGTSSHAVSTGFQPNFVSIKRSGASTGTFQTSSMATDVSQIYDANNEVTNGTGIRTLDATGFTVGSGARVNTSSDTYWFYAFKTTSNAFAVGTYTGNGTTQSITVGFRPQYAMVKISNGTAAAPPVFNQTESGSDYSSSISDLSNSTGLITSLDSNGFSVGNDAKVNESGKTLYWIAFAGAASPSASGTFKLKVGSYTGNGTSQSLSSFGFAPDLVLIKDESGSNYGVFRTRLMKGDTSGYLANAVVNFAGGSTSLDSDGFSVGSGVTVNTNGTVYHYQAFGNAYNPETNTGAADFAIGAHTGSGGDSRDILRLPFQPNLVVGKTNGTVAGTWRISAETGDLSLPFDNVAESADFIQALNSDGFQVGTNVRMNSSGNLNYWFAFKTSNSMSVGSYAGTGSAQNVTAPGYSPNLAWIKSASTTYAVFRPSTIAGDSTQYFTNSAAVSDRITAFISTGFSIGGNQPQTNTASTDYHYATWVAPSAPNTPTLDSPADSATNQSLTPALLTTATDSSSDYLRYKIELCTNVGMTTGCQTFDETSSQTGWSGQDAQTSTAYASGTQATYTIQSALSASTTYYWRSYAIDPGGTNAWSSTQTPRSFTTTTAPSAPTTPYTEGATNPTGIVDLTPEFSGIHNDANADAATYYQINVNTASDFSGTSMWDSGTVSMTSTADAARSPDISYAGTALSYGGTTYYWRVRFTDTKGAVGAWSTAASFATNSTSSTPSLSSPADGATGVSTTASLATSTTDTNSDYLRYKIELCTNVGMSAGCQTFDQTSSQTGWSGQDAQTSTAYASGTLATYTIQSALSESTTYYWRSYAIDPGGTNAWSATPTPRSFTTTGGGGGGGSVDFSLEGVSLEGVSIN